MVDRYARVVDSRVNHPERVGLRSPAEAVNRLGVWRLRVLVHLVHRDHLAFARLGQQVVVLKAPPGGGVAAEVAAFVFGVAAGARQNIQNAHFQHIAGLGIAHVYRAGADMHAKPFATAAAKDAGICRAGATAVDVLLLAGPVKDAFGAGVAADHAFAVVGGVLGERLDGDDVARAHAQRWLDVAAEVAPMHGFVGGRQVILAGAGIACLVGW